MKILKNSFDKETTFTSLEAAKKYYLPEDAELSKEDYVGKDYQADDAAWREYRGEIEEAESLEELAEVLNRYSDRFGNGSSWSVKDI